jgi:hypothetical protein
MFWLVSSRQSIAVGQSAAVVAAVTTLLLDSRECSVLAAGVVAVIVGAS